ncbi:MAG: V-type ATPase 116kDa subunit family protein [Pseudomonadota bacterium]|nr:V-type ATPase 116kDa subunit family protein [Pseudomonadota bacterium]
MALRPAQARWFETYVPRDQTVRATEVLADTGVVQLELAPRLDETPHMERLRFFLDHFTALALEHEEDLPAGVAHPTALIGDSAHIANLALHRLRVWSAQVDYLREHLAQLRAEHDHLVLLAECLEALHPAGIDLDGVFRETRFLCKCLFACPHGREIAPELGGVVERVAHGPQHVFLYFVGAPEQRAQVSRLVIETECEQVGIPAWLSGDHEQQKHLLLAQLALKTHEIAGLDTRLRTLRKDAGVAEARANVDTLSWYLEHAAHTLGEHKLCHVTGWTTCADPQRLQQALHEAEIKALVRFPDPPADAVVPVALLNAWWARPFQPLLRMWGTPGGSEVDPSGLLAVVVPLLFGYMFPDVGHGLMLALFAALFWKRWPQIRFLIPCGISAMAFGLVFGDVFGRDDLIPALWLKPLDNPLAVLAAPLLFGVGLMLLGMLFSGVAAGWRGELRTWLWLDGALLLLYAGALLGLFVPAAFWLMALGFIQYLVGTLVIERDPRALPGAIGQLLLSSFELAMNTLSFIRVGAFALGHAALSLAVMTLASGVEHPLAVALVLLLGNLFSLVLEGLVVYVQTTRLVLFEFFTRFLREEGQLFRPLRRPL